MDGLASKLLWWPKLIAEVGFVIICLIPILIKELFHLIIPRKCKDLNGKVALVTGAAQGMGREMALELARKGCSVICVDILARENEVTAKDIIKLGQKSSSHTCDLTNREAVMQLANKVGPIDILINNAGLIYFDPLLETPPNIIRKLLDINVTSQFWMLQAFLPGMIERKRGHIVSIASCGGLEGLANAVLYSASKHAVVGLMKTLAEELRLNSLHNIKCSCVCPWFVKTIKDVETRIDSRIPPIEVKEAAVEIIQGIQQELPLFTVPSCFLGMFTFQSVFPLQTQNMMRDVFYTRVRPRDESEKPPEVIRKCE